jgi:hypothetical protein
MCRVRISGLPTTCGTGVRTDCSALSSRAAWGTCAANLRGVKRPIAAARELAVRQTARLAARARVPLPPPLKGRSAAAYAAQHLSRQTALVPCIVAAHTAVIPRFTVPCLALRYSLVRTARDRVPQPGRHGSAQGRVRCGAIACHALRRLSAVACTTGVCGSPRAKRQAPAADTSSICMSHARSCSCGLHAHPEPRTALPAPLADPASKATRNAAHPTTHLRAGCGGRGSRVWRGPWPWRRPLAAWAASGRRPTSGTGA